ncbi:MAG TPA: hypothetical protein VGI39_19145 [Polyangiaceae bacterium]|jgi:hypothetical protein
MTLHLLACPNCSRHVRATELACPFCDAALSDAFRATPAPVPPAVRLARAALVALGAGAVVATAACGGATSVGGPNSTEDGGGDSASSPPDEGGVVAVYGAPPVRDAGQDSGVGIAPPYGIAPPPPPEDAEAPPHDAGTDAIIVVPYGLPPVPPGHDPS